MSLENQFSIADVFDKSNVAFCLLKVELDENGKPDDLKFVYLNDAFAALERIPKEKIMNKYFYEIYPNGSRSRLNTYYEGAYENKCGEIHNIIEEIGLFLKIRCFPVKYGYCGLIVEDIRETHELRKNQIENQIITNALSSDYMNIYRIDFETGRTTGIVLDEEFSKTYGAIYGNGTYNELMTLYLNDVYDADKQLFHQIETLDKLKALIDKNKTYIFNYRIMNRPNYQYLQAHFVGVRIEGKDYAVMAYRNISDTVAKDLMIQTELEEQRKLVEDALARAENASKAKTTFLSNMSHDIRTPMNAIIGYTTLAMTHIDNKEQVKEYLSKIATSNNHLLSLINDVLDMTRIESGKMHLDETECNLSEIMHELRNILLSDLNARNLNFFIDTVDVFDEDIICDKLRLTQVLLNLLGNSIKFTKPGGSVSVRIIEKPGKNRSCPNYIFYIRDTGIGMSEEFLEHVFEPFEREHNTTVSGIEGTGLGMPITKNIIEMMNGTITVKSKKGEGTEFTVTLPIKKSKMNHTEIVLDGYKGVHALVVDDDFNTCDSVSSMLIQVGMRAEWTLSGKEAVLRARQASERQDAYQVYVIDWIMPEMNGIETARQIRREVGENDTIIILTSYDWSDVEEEARAAGVTAFVSKPLFISDLRRCLIELAHPENKKEEIITAGKSMQGQRILLVEDNDLNRDITTEILGEVGLLIEEACDGEEAIQKLLKHGPGYYKLVLMDIQMPKMDGYTATKEIRSFEDRDLANVPIIAMTANAFEDDRKRAFEAGMNAHISKPLDVKKLFETIEGMI